MTNNVHGQNAMMMPMLLPFCMPCVVDCMATMMMTMCLCLFDDHEEHLILVASMQSKHPLQSNPYNPLQGKGGERGGGGHYLDF
mmetsp:Transcript_122369/g.212200  ORF Transcript_122369/g.212200 Transcript_122369/m.212200 type:complete len:84 (+) Transcript_122369:118-369(+)